MSKIEATQQLLKNLFSDKYLFSIPPYQRPYAWTTEETSELLDDLLYAMRERRKSDDEYFLGSIVIIQENAGKPEAEVVDGQQRLTTLTILLCVLRELSDGNMKRHLDQFIRQEENELRGTKSFFRLTLRERDKEFFEEKVLTPDHLQCFLKELSVKRTDSQQRIFENAKYLWGELSEQNREDRDKLAQFVSQNCCLVVVSTPDLSSAYRIFAVMNARGLDLSPTDILKAEITGEIEPAIRSEYTDKWEGIEEELGRDNFRDLFEHIRMIYMKGKARKALNQEFRDGVLARIEKENKFIDEVLTPYADTYKAIIRANYESTNDTDEVNRYLKHLNRLDNSDWIPPAMAFIERNKGNASMLIQFVRYLERLAYSMFITRMNINQRIDRYGNIIRGIEGNQALYEDTTLLQLSGQEKKDLLDALNGPIYSLTRVRRTLLMRLDSLLADAGASYDLSSISVEHVLPQTPGESSEWTHWFPDEEERMQWTDKLANLVLLSPRRNSRAQNYDFARKKSEYFQRDGAPPFPITTQVVNESEWTPAVLERRQRDLVGRLKKEWRLG